MRSGVDVKSVGPLTSWDIFLQGYRHAQQLADDRNALVKMSKESQWHQTFDFRYQLFQLQKTVLVTTPRQEIVYASSSLYAMNGYLPGEVIGQTPRMFQGKDTKEETRAYVRAAVQNIQAFETTIINYRKDGSLYNCHIHAIPLFNRNKQLVNFIAFESLV